MKYKINWSEIGLGTKPDSVISDELNIDRRKICYHRNKLGIKPFAGYLLTQEGDACRSVYEAKYDAYLHKNNINHRHQIPLKDLGIISDFGVDEKIIEIAGMMAYSKYRKRYNKKRQIYKKHDIQVRWLYPDDIDKLYKNCNLPLKICSDRICKRCGKKTYDLLNGICRGSCYMKEYRKRNSIQNECQYCHKKYDAMAKDHRKFCNIKCYWNSMAFGMDLLRIKEEMEHKSIRKIALELGIKYMTLYSRIKGLRKMEH